MHVAGDLLFPILNNNHYYLMRIFFEDMILNVHMYNSVGMERRTLRFKVMVGKFFTWFSVLYLYHPLINKKEKGLEVQSKSAPIQTGIKIGYMMNICVSKTLFNLAFTQLDISKLCQLIVKHDKSDYLLESLILACINIPKQYQKNLIILPAESPINGTKKKVCSPLSQQKGHSQFSA